MKTGREGRSFLVRGETRGVENEGRIWVGASKTAVVAYLGIYLLHKDHLQVRIEISQLQNHVLRRLQKGNASWWYPIGRP